MSDDLDMKALQYAINGGLKERAEAALKAGCDVVLQCSGVLAEMEETAEGCVNLSGLSLVRARAAESFAKRTPDAFDAEAGWAPLQDFAAAKIERARRRRETRLILAQPRRLKAPMHWCWRSMPLKGPLHLLLELARAQENRSAIDLGGGDRRSIHRVYQ